MKKYVVLSISISFIIMISLAAKIIYQESDKKVNSFSTSIKHEEKKEYDKAIQTLLQNYDENKSSYLFNLRLGWLYYSKADYTKSKSYYQKAADIKKNSTEALLALTLPASKLEDWNMIQNIYTRILKIDENNFYANLYLGQIYFNKTEYGKARELFERIYELNPGSYDAILNLGWTYYNLGKISEARELFLNALMLSSNDASAKKGFDLTR